MPAVANKSIGVIKTITASQVFISYTDITNTVHYILKARTGNSTRAEYKGNYFDAGQKIRINYVKFYHKPLVSSDSVTVTIDTDYGTSNTLGTITYSADGAVTEKKFYKGIICHSFRPTISWTAGGVAFSKIVMDYDFISD